MLIEETCTGVAPVSMVHWRHVNVRRLLGKHKEKGSILCML